MLICHVCLLVCGVLFVWLFACVCTCWFVCLIACHDCSLVMLHFSLLFCHRLFNFVVVGSIVCLLVCLFICQCVGFFFQSCIHFWSLLNFCFSLLSFVFLFVLFVVCLLFLFLVSLCLFIAIHSGFCSGFFFTSSTTGKSNHIIVLHLFTTPSSYIFVAIVTS